MTRRFFKSKKGFTLIELLVVIAIIGVLASIVLASLNTARRKGRDTRRVADIGQIRLANELYFDSQRSYAVGTYAALAAALAPTYIAVVPNDPLGAPSYVYQSLTAAYAACAATPCPSYVLGATLEDATAIALTTDIDGTVGGVACADPVYCQQN